MSHVFKWDMTHSMTHSYATWLIHMRHDSCIWDMTHAYETWLIQCDTTNSHETWLIPMRHDSFIWDTTHPYETWLIHMRHDSSIRHMCYLWHTYGVYEMLALCVTDNVHMGYAEYWCYVCHMPFIWGIRNVGVMCDWWHTLGYAGRTVTHNATRCSTL